MEKKEIVQIAVAAAVTAQVVMAALLMVMFLFVAATSARIDVPGVRWNPGSGQGGD